MGSVFVDITTSLDGFVAGPNDAPGLGLGEGGERLHEWIYGLKSWREPHGLDGGETGIDDEIMGEAFERAGAVVLGRRMYDNAEGWGDEPPFHVPVFVLTNRPSEPLTKAGGTTFTFVSDGIEGALELAREAAGDRDVSVAGGAATIQQFLAAGLVDEIQIHVAPLLLGGGVRLFADDGPALTLERDRVVDSPAVTHLRYRFPGERKT